MSENDTISPPERDRPRSLIGDAIQKELDALTAWCKTLPQKKGTFTVRTKQEHQQRLEQGQKNIE